MGTATAIIHYSFFCAAVCYLSGLCVSISRRHHWAFILLMCGLLANLISIGMRYWQSFPMMPLYQGPFFLPLFIGLLSMKTVRNDYHKGVFFLALISGMALAALFFPNDYYLPFIQFKTPLSHLFFFFGIVGKAFFLLAGAVGMSSLRQQKRENSNVPSARTTEHMVTWGFAFWTLSVFAGAVWSYLGWGTPVVWDDPVITTAMATWLFYGLFLHLHLMSFGTRKNRMIFAVIGAVWVFLFNCVPDMGEFLVPRI